MKYIYVVDYGEYDDYTIVAICSSKEIANMLKDEWISKNNDNLYVMGEKGISVNPVELNKFIWNGDNK